MFTKMSKPTLIKISALIILISLALLGTLSARTSFRLTSNKIFKEGERTYIRLSSSDVDEIQFKLYRIDDPFDFFQNQPDVHYIKRPTIRPGETGVEKASGLQQKFTEWRRDFFSSEMRMKLIELLGAKEEAEEEVQESEKGKMEIREKKEEFKEIPFLNDKNLTLKWTEKISGERDRWNYKDVEVQKEGDVGLYLIEANAENKFAYTAMIVTNMALITKQSAEKMLVYAVDRETGEPINDAEIMLMKNQRVIADGDTDKNGLVEFSTSGSGSEHFVVMGKKKDNFAISDPYFWYGRTTDQYTVYTYTERPVYRPNQTVYIKSIVRKMKKGQYENAPNVEASLIVRDARGTEIYKNQKLVTNEFGSITDSLELAEEPPLGNYEISIEIGENTYWSNFKVKEYKKPEYKVTVKTDEQTYVFGERISASVQADYYFGAPVQNAEVRYYVYRSRYWIPWWYWYDSQYSWYFEDSDEDYYYYDSQIVHEGEGTLDKHGRFNFTVYSDSDYDENSVYRIEATVEDKSRRQVVGSTSVKVTVGEFFLRAIADKYVYTPGETITTTIRSIDFQKNPVSVEGELRVIRREWKGGNYAENLVTRHNFSTQKGRGDVTFTIDDVGYYLLEAVATDSRGREIMAKEYVYVSESKSRYYFYSDGLDIIPDKNSYKTGETAHIMVIAPAKNVHALVTIEGEEIYDYSVVSVDGSSFIVDIPIEDRYSPNAFIKVVVVHGDRIYQQQEPIIVPPENKFLDITVTSDKETYEPQETATFTIEARNADGNPTDAEISLGIVDEALYYIAEESTEDIRKFFYSKRWNKINTNSSFYFSFYGYSREEDMASRRDENKEIEEEAFSDFKGGDKKKARVRKDFRDMIMWQPTVRTGSDGKAVLKVKYPDNLTTWRATARAITKDTKVGSTTQKTISKQDLICRLETPRFFTQGDMVTLSTIVHNYLDEEKECDVSLKIKGDELMLLDATNSQTIMVPSNGEVRLDWLVEAVNVGEVNIIGEALTNEKSDAMQLTIPILPWGQYQGSSLAGELKDQKETTEETIYIPEEAIDGTVSMRLSLSPTLATTMLSALEYLIGYPYGCTEQTMSRFLPDVFVADIMNDLGMEDKEIMKKLPDMVEKGLQRLANYQHYDGGWGWWKNDESDAFMTAYVVFGLAKAREAGFDVPSGMLTQGSDWLMNEVIDTKNDDVTRAYMIYAIACADENPDKDFLIEQINKLNQNNKAESYTLALLTLSLDEMESEDMAKTYVKTLEQQVIEQPPNAYWGGVGQKALLHWQDDRFEITATAIRAIAKLNPDSDQLFPAVRWLIMNRQGNKWKSTKDTATIIYSLVDFLKARGELNPDYQLSVYVNDERVKQLRVKDKESFRQLSEDIILESQSLKQGENNKIRIEKDGKGSLYYSTYTSFYNQAEHISSTSHGISLSRNYYRLIPTRTSSGTWEYAKYPLSYGDAITSGSEIMVELNIEPNQHYEYVMLEDPLPSGCEIIEDDQRYTIAGEDNEDDYWYDWGWSYWYSQREFRDEKATFFMREVWSEPETITYVLRAEKPGYFRVMPAKIELMYMPEVGGNTEGFELEITE